MLTGVLVLMIISLEIYYSKKFKYIKWKESAYQNYLEQHQYSQFNPKKIKSIDVFKWDSQLEKRIQLLSLKLNLTKLILKPKHIFLYGQTLDMRAFNHFWKHLKLDNYQDIKLIRWKNISADGFLNNWSYVIRVGF